MSRCYTHPTTRLGRSAKHGGVGHGLDEYRRNGSCSWRRRFDGLLHHGEAMLLALTAGVGATVALSVSGSSLLGLLLNCMDVAAVGSLAAVSSAAGAMFALRLYRLKASPMGKTGTGCAFFSTPTAMIRQL